VNALERHNEKHPPSRGDTREWRKCRDCAKVFSYDYLPYSIGNPMRWTPCGHSLGHRDLNCDTIDEEEANTYLEAIEAANYEPSVPTFKRSPC